MKKRGFSEEQKLDPHAEALVHDIRDRARNLYETGQLLCTEAVVVALNRGFRGGLSDAQAVSMAAPFCEGLGDSGCLCGSLSGAVMACGLILGNEGKYSQRRDLRESARELHDAFRNASGATCCRVLSRHVRHDKKAHFSHCADLTAIATELAARLILQKRPDLIGRADKKYLSKRQTRIGGALSRVWRFILR